MNSDIWGIVRLKLDDPNILNAVSRWHHQTTRLKRDQLVYNYVCGRMFPCQGPEKEPPIDHKTAPEYRYKTYFHSLYHFYQQVDKKRRLVSPHIGCLLLLHDNEATFVHPPDRSFKRLLGCVHAHLIGLSSEGLLLWNLNHPKRSPKLHRIKLFDASILRGDRLLLVKPNSIEIREGSTTYTLRNVKKDHYKTWSGNIVGWECIKIGQHLFLLINNASELNCYNANTGNHLWTKKLGGIFSKIYTWYVKGEVRIGIGDQWFSFLPPSRKRKREEMERSESTHLENSK